MVAAVAGTCLLGPQYRTAPCHLSCAQASYDWWSNDSSMTRRPTPRLASQEQAGHRSRFESGAQSSVVRGCNPSGTCFACLMTWPTD
ncbi:hypothetical protein IG631_22978 [Alternaria alternata]|nr:hypothetical protein IG631_22978 [Alternaria alternata]